MLPIVGMKILHIMNGGQAIESYMQTIIASSKSIISPEVSSILFGVIQFPAGKFKRYSILISFTKFLLIFQLFWRVIY